MTAEHGEPMIIAGEGSKVKWFDGQWQVGWLQVPEKLGKRKCR